MSDSAERLRRAMDVYEPRLKYSSPDVILGLNDESIRYSDVRAVLAQRDELLGHLETLLALYDETERTHEDAYYAFFKHGAHEMWEGVRAAIANAKRGAK